MTSKKCDQGYSMTKRLVYSFIYSIYSGLWEGCTHSQNCTATVDLRLSEPSSWDLGWSEKSISLKLFLKLFHYSNRTVIEKSLS